MLARLVAFALRMPVIIVALALSAVALGLVAYSELDIEAYPNPVAPMIEIITQPEGWSAEEVERYVTIPIETGLSGMIELDHIRSQSLFGLSDIKCYFSWNVDYYTAQQRVLNRLGFIDLPSNAKPTLSPWSAVGEVYRYRVTGKGYTLMDLKTAQDWILEKQFRQVPGVIDVSGFGGFTKQYHVEVDPFRLKGHGLTLSRVSSAIANSNENVGGQRLTLGEQSFNVRGVGLIRSVHDIENIVIDHPKGVPVRVRDVADVRIGPAPRLGLVGHANNPDVVQGIVLMRYGGNSMTTLQGVHDRIKYIRDNRLLPPGMDIETAYDRSRLVKLTTHTVIENLLVGMLLVTLVLWVFLGKVRAALLTAVNLPLALFAAFIGMVATGTPANLISLGAVDFGIVVESTVLMVENIFRHVSTDSSLMHERILDAAREVGPAMLFSTLIIAAAFIPLFTMEGVAGVIFAPMAYTYAFAIGGAILLAVTLTPVLAAVLLRKKPSAADDDHEVDNWLMRKVRNVYSPLFSWALRKPKVAIVTGLTPVLLALAASTILGREFMPKLEEGNFWIRATLPMSIALEQSSQYVGRMRGIVLGCPGGNLDHCDESKRSHPEIETVISHLGRPDDGTDVSGFYNIELLAPLKPSDEWRPGTTKADMTEQLSQELRSAFPGVVFNFSQAISDNVEEAMSGVKGENTIKIVGPDLQVDEKKAEQILDAMSTVGGVTDLGIFRVLGQPAIRITPDRLRAGQYGLNVGDIESVVQAAIGGQAITQVFEGEKRFDLTIRWAPPYRKDPAAIRGILVSAADGTQVPLGQVAEIVEEQGPAVIYREDARRYVPVKFSVRGRDLGSTIDEARAKVTKQVHLPYDTHLEWAGEIDQLRETTDRLKLILPITLLLITFLVYSSVKNWKDAGIVLLGIPVACSGGVAALFLTATNFSISAAMGFISIFGIAVQDALVVVTHAQELVRSGTSWDEAAKRAADRGLRPALMTTFVAMLGLLPAAISRGLGAETQKPLAIVVIGGAIALTLLPRLLQPALLILAHKTSRAPSAQV